MAGRAGRATTTVGQFGSSIGELMQHKALDQNRRTAARAKTARLSGEGIVLERDDLTFLTVTISLAGR